LQENESTNYVIGVMGDAIDYDELPNLWSTTNGSNRVDLKPTNIQHLSIMKLPQTTAQ
jgi:hypothetical protein